MSDKKHNSQMENPSIKKSDKNFEELKILFSGKSIANDWSSILQNEFLEEVLIK